MIVGGLIFLGIWCNIENVFKLIPNGEIYAQGKWVVFYIGISKLFDMATGVNQEIVGTSKYYKIDLLFYLFLVVVAVITNLIFIPYMELQVRHLHPQFQFFFLTQSGFYSYSMFSKYSHSH